MARVRLLPHLVPPAAALRLGVLVVAVGAAVAGVIAVIAGPAPAIASALGCLAVLSVAMREGPWWQPAYLAVVVAVGAAGATLASDTPWLVGLVVAGTVLACVPLVLTVGPVLGAAPVAVATAGTDAATIGPFAAAVGVLLGAVTLALVIRRMLPRRLPASPPSRPVTWTYVIALAVGAGGAIAVARAINVPHGVWTVVALAGVLVPTTGDTSRQAASRVVGTFAGAIAGAALGIVLPVWALVTVGAFAMIAGIGWTAARSQRAAGAYYALGMVLLITASQPGVALETAAQRAALTLVGGALAAVLALVIARVERVSEARS